LPFGTVADKKVELYTIDFPEQLKASVTNYGGILTSLYLPDKVGKMENVVLGYQNSKDYGYNPNYFGAIIGRCCSRIADGSFMLAGREYSIPKNNGHNHLHGGIRGFDRVIWEVVDIIESTNKAANIGVVLSIPIARYFKVAPNGWSEGMTFLHLPFLDQMFWTWILSMALMDIVSCLETKGADSDKSIVLTSELFRTECGFNISALVIIIILIALYLTFWWFSYSSFKALVGFIKAAL